MSEHPQRKYDRLDPAALPDGLAVQWIEREVVQCALWQYKYRNTSWRRAQVCVGGGMVLEG